MNPPPHYRYRDESSAKRFHEQISLAQLALSRDEILRGRWIALRLSDGGSDRHTYDSAQECMKHQLAVVMPFQIPLERLSVVACDSLLMYFRGVYDAGWRPQADDPMTLFVPNRIEDL